jgi:hypothetical protein
MSVNTIPGLLLPTQKGMLAGNPRDSAIEQGNAANLKLQSLQSIGGRRFKKTRAKLLIGSYAVQAYTQIYR